MRTTLEAKAREVSGRVSALRVESGGEGVAVEAVMLMPRHMPGIDAQLQRQDPLYVFQPRRQQLDFVAHFVPDLSQLVPCLAVTRWAGHSAPESP